MIGIKMRIFIFVILVFVYAMTEEKKCTKMGIKIEKAQIHLYDCDVHVTTLPLNETGTYNHNVFEIKVKEENIVVVSKDDISREFDFKKEGFEKKTFYFN